MGRWGPDARGPLEQAAVELCLEHGFEQIRVVEIAQRAGFSERTFYRYFPDKPEVLFAGFGFLHGNVVSMVVGAPVTAGPMEAVATAFEQAGAVFRENAVRLRQRQHVIDGHPELQARELSKVATLAAAVAEALRQRGVPDPAAMLAAEAGTLVFRITFRAWIRDAGDQEWPRMFRQTLDAVGAVIVGTPPTPIPVT
ncbi:TetR family transcriptional regulator [Deinococcus altitudinis]|uniref:TetR family transcriptional regulator n=1 Tax=Deinococcus altitudinis TaxID=468914 RepID=UPI0038923A5B